MTRRQASTTLMGSMVLAGCEKAGQTKTADPAEWQFNYSILLDGASPRRVSEKYHFRSGDRFRLEFLPAFPAFVYVLNRGTGQNEYAFLFPNDHIAKSNPWAGGETVTLPGGNDWYTLDDQPGIENMVLIAAAEALPDFGAAGTPIPREDCEQRIALLERERHANFARRLEDHDWVKLFANRNTKTVIALRLPVDHR